MLEKLENITLTEDDKKLILSWIDEKIGINTCEQTCIKNNENAISALDARVTILETP